MQSTTVRVWIACGLIYAAFFSWYTSFKGPLDAREIEAYMTHVTRAEAKTSPEARQRLRRFMETDTGDDFVMLNAIDMYAKPLQIPGVGPTDSTQAVLDKYMQHMYPAMFARASHPVFTGNAANSAIDLMNAPNMEHWTMGAGIRYRSRRDFMDIVSNPACVGSHDLKVAALVKTIAYPVDPFNQLGDPRVVLALLLGLIAALLSWRISTRP